MNRYGLMRQQTGRLFLELFVVLLRNSKTRLKQLFRSLLWCFGRLPTLIERSSLSSGIALRTVFGSFKQTPLPIFHLFVNRYGSSKR